MATPDEWYNLQLAQYLNGSMPKAHLFDLGTAQNFGFSGWHTTRITMQQFVVEKALGRHAIDSAALLNLPSLMAKPLVIFRSQSQVGAFVTLIDSFCGCDRLVVATHCLVHKNLGPQHAVRSIHPRPQHQLDRWVVEGLVLYEKKEKSQAQLQDSAPCN